MIFRCTAAFAALAISAFVPSPAGASDAQVQDQLQQMQQRIDATCRTGDHHRADIASGQQRGVAGRRHWPSFRYSRSRLTSGSNRPA